MNSSPLEATREDWARCFSTESFLGTWVAPTQLFSAGTTEAGTMRQMGLKELRALYLLIGECRELGSDPVIWRCHMLERLGDLLGASLTFCSEGSRDESHFQQRIVDVGWSDEKQRKIYQRWLAEHGPEKNPFSVCLPAPIRPFATYCRRQLVDDATWYRSDFVRMLCELNLDDVLGSYHVDTCGLVHTIVVQRALGAKPFGDREQRLLELFQAELIPMTGRTLASLDTPTVVQIAPRLRQTLLCLMQGCSEKQVAKRLGLSVHTVHDYVKKLHKHFGVSSRSELLHRCVRLYPVLVRLENDTRHDFTFLYCARTPA